MNKDNTRIFKDRINKYWMRDASPRRKGKPLRVVFFRKGEEPHHEQLPEDIIYHNPEAGPMVAIDYLVQPALLYQFAVNDENLPVQNDEAEKAAIGLQALFTVSQSLRNQLATSTRCALSLIKTLTLSSLDMFTKTPSYLLPALRPISLQFTDKLYSGTALP